MRFVAAYVGALAASRAGLYHPFMNEITQILAKIEGGDPAAAEHLLPLVYEEQRLRPASCTQIWPRIFNCLAKNKVSSVAGRVFTTGDRFVYTGDSRLPTRA